MGSKILFIVGLLVMSYVVGYSAEELKEKKAQKQVLIIDTRTIDEYQKDHCENALHIPYDEIEKVEKLELSKDTVMLVYCEIGARAGVAVTELKNRGYKNSFNVGTVANINDAYRKLDKKLILKLTQCCKSHHQEAI